MDILKILIRGAHTTENGFILIQQLSIIESGSRVAEQREFLLCFFSLRVLCGYLGQTESAENAEEAKPAMAVGLNVKRSNPAMNIAKS